MIFGEETAENYYDEGVTALMKGDLRRAVGLFQKSVQLDSTFYAAYQQLAKCFLRLGKTERAAALLERVVQEQPNFTAARMDYGYALMANGKPMEARRQFEQVIATDPSNGRAYLGLGRAAFELCDWREALVAANAAQAQGLQNFAVLFLLARAAKFSNHETTSAEAFVQAEALIKKSIELNPDDPAGYYLLGEVNYAKEQYVGALENFNQARTRAKRQKQYHAFGEGFTYVDILAKQGLCYQRIGAAGEARLIGQRILELAPQHKLGQALTQVPDAVDE